MADSKASALTENTAPLGSDLEYMVDDPGGSPLSQKIYKGSNNLLPEGYMVNGKISVTVASNNITVALKTLSGGNPSATDPVSVWINGSFRRCTAALSVTKNAGTNWFNSGGAALATQEVDYFVYLIWNTTPATDIVDLGFARTPYGRVYSNFSSTTTNETYLAFANASTPTSTDSCVVVGRFAATLSAGAGYTWSVPTFTNANLIQYPVYETRWLTYTGTVTAGSGTITTVGATTFAYQIVGRNIKWYCLIPITTNGTGATSLIHTLPVTPAVTYQIANGRETVSTGNQLQGVPATNTIVWRVYDNSYPMADGRTLVGGGENRWT